MSKVVREPSHSAKDLESNALDLPSPEPNTEPEPDLPNEFSIAHPKRLLPPSLRVPEGPGASFSNDDLSTTQVTDVGIGKVTAWVSPACGDSEGAAPSESECDNSLFRVNAESTLARLGMLSVGSEHRLTQQPHEPQVQRHSVKVGISGESGSLEVSLGEQRVEGQPPTSRLQIGASVQLGDGTLGARVVQVDTVPPTTIYEVGATIPVSKDDVFSAKLTAQSRTGTDYSGTLGWVGPEHSVEVQIGSDPGSNGVRAAAALNFNF